MSDQSLTDNPIVQSLTNNPIVLNVKQPLQNGQVVKGVEGLFGVETFSGKKVNVFRVTCDSNWVSYDHMNEYDRFVIWRGEVGTNLDIGSPLDQFSIYPIYDLFIGNYYFSFTNLALFMLLTLVLVVLLFFVVTKKGGGKLVPNAWQSLVELIYDFVLNLVNEQIGGLSGNVKQKFFPCILVTFTFLLFCNLQGMIPFSFTVTSHFLITLALSFSIFIGITIVGFQRHGLHFFSFLLPAGVPLPLAPFLVLLELISYCFRALSLGIRLFANMMAGHSLVKILSGFAWTMLFLNNIFYFIGDLGPLFIVLALTGLELGVAILQAYVFTILICIYLNDAINLH
jgi:F-type H+-transporting ATPase subunit a